MDLVSNAIKRGVLTRRARTAMRFFPEGDAFSLLTLMGDASGTADPRVRQGAEDGVYYVQNAESGQTETWKVGARYRLLSVLGCGSYGAVCKAADVHARRLVALKRVPDALNTLESAKRVLREVVVLNRLDHPNIIKVFDCSTPPPPPARDA